MTNLPAKFSRDGGGGGGWNSVSNIEKVGLVFYTVPYSFYCKRVSVNNV